MKSLVRAALLTILIAASVAITARGEDMPYTEGPVVDMTFVRLKSGGEDAYLNFLATQWKATNEAAKKDGLILSYRVVSATAANRDDWDLMLIIEYKNMAALDGLEAKMRPIMEKLAGSIAKANEQATKRDEVREIVGEKIGRELILK